MLSKLRQTYFTYFNKVVLSWQPAQKAALATVLAIIEIFIYMGWLLYINYHPDTHQFVNIDVVQKLLYLCLPTIFIATTLAILLWQLRHKDKLQLLLQFVMVIGYSIEAGYLGYLIGQTSLVAGVAFTGSTLLALILLDRRIAYFALCVNTLSLFAILYASNNGILPPTPLYVDPQQGYNSFWVLSFFYLTFFKLVIIFSVADSILFSLKENYKKIRHLSEHDPLTGLLNRHQLYNAMQQVIGSNSPHSLILLDLDFFKRINDTYGHLTGDRVLITLANFLKTRLRNTDQVGRFGGEEFLLFLPHTNTLTAFKIAERLRKSLYGLVVYDEIGQKVPIRASFGLVSTTYLTKKGSYQQSDNTEVMINKLVDLADKALYYAKTTGRDKVVVISPEIETVFNKNKPKKKEKTTTTNVLDPHIKASEVAL